MTRFWLPFLIICSTLAALVAPSVASAGWEVGTATKSINPTADEIATGKVYLGGYGFAANPITGGRSATGVLDEGVSVRAFVVSDGTNGFAIANMEMQGWFVATKDGPYGIVDMRRAVESATDGGLKASQVVIQSDHSHSAPDPMGVWGGIPLAYRKRIFDRTVEAVTAAWKNRKAAAQLVYGTAPGNDGVNDLVANQFDWDDANKNLDHEIRVLQARDGDGQPIATLLNANIHTTVLGSSNTKVSGDWVQRTNPQLEARLGGDAVTIVGTLGRQQPRDRGCTDLLAITPEQKDLCKLDDFSEKIVDRVEVALGNAVPIGDPVVKSASYLIQDPATNPALLGLMAAGDTIGAPLNRSHQPPWLTGNILGTVSATARIGNVLLSAGPGEMYMQIPEKVREIVGPKALGFMTAGLANDQLGYIIAPAPDAYPGPVCATFFEDCHDHTPTTPGALPNDNYFFNVSHTMGERLTCSLLRGAGDMFGEDYRSKYDKCGAFANDMLLPAGADTGRPTEPVTDLLGNGTITGDGKPGAIKAGVAVEDATFKVGPSGGQYASTKAEWDPRGEIDPSVMQVKNTPSYGIQSRLDTRALVLEGADGRRYAVVKNDLYIPQDLLWRRTATILEESGKSKVTRETLTIAASHNHSSPYYASTSWGAWAFQDVFDIRFFEYYAQQMAKAVMRAEGELRPVKVGASVGYLDKVHRNSMGPGRADDGTPAGYPVSDSDHDLTVIRFDNASDDKPYALLVNWSLHPEFLEGNNLISGDYVAPLQRMVDRASGATVIYTQGSVGTSEPERSTYHSIHERLEFSHKDYAQADYGARLIADEVLDTFADIEKSEPEYPERFVPLTASAPVAQADRWYPGPLSHPYPGVSSCRTDALLSGDPRIPILGLPDCTSPGRSPVDPGVTTDTLQQAGVPIPENYSAPSYTGLQEDVSIHLSALRIGEIVLTMCSCEQWVDQSRNIETRANDVYGDQYFGYDWSERCEPVAGGTYSCVNPHNESAKITITGPQYRKMRAQVRNDAVGWDFVENAPYAESEPTDPAAIRGNFTHEELTPADGYKLVVPVGMANDYNGYIASYREYQRGDHYRKALTGWGPHSSDYMATRLVQLAGHLKRGDGGTEPVLATEPERELADSMMRVKTDVDMAFNDARVQGLKALATIALPAYEALLPAEAGTPGVETQPANVERFGAAHMRWVGGSNYTDTPQVKVQRQVDGEWKDYADMSGEVQLRVDYPRADNGDLLSWATSGFAWRWTATFEAFASPFDTGERPRATPVGTYRFVVDGHHRSGVPVAPKPYHLESDEFQVTPWDGITVEDFRKEDDGTVSLQVGPRSKFTAPAQNAQRPAVEDVVGPIDYPDSYDGALKDRFVRNNRTVLRDPADPNNPDLFEWFCFTCSFRPWVDAGDAETVSVRITNTDGTSKTVAAQRSGGRWRTDYVLVPGDTAQVLAGGVKDEWGNVNGAPSATITIPGGNPPPAPEPEPDPTPDPTPDGGGSTGGGTTGGGTTGGGTAGQSEQPLPAPARSRPREAGPETTVLTRIAGVRASCVRARGTRGRVVCTLRTANPIFGRVTVTIVRSGRKVAGTRARLAGGHAKAIVRGRRRIRRGDVVRIQVKVGNRTQRLTARLK